MQTIRIGPRALTTGLVWNAIPESANLKKAIAAHKGARFGLIQTVGRARTVGLVLGTKKRPREPSGAAWLALAQQARQMEETSASLSGQDEGWMLIETLDATTVWYVAVKDGLVQGASDLVGRRDEVLRRVEQDLLDAEHTQARFVVYTDDAAIQQTLTEHGATVRPGGWAALVGDTDGRPAAIRQVAGIPRVVLLGAALLVLALGVMEGYHRVRTAYLAHLQALAAARAAALALAKTEAAQRAYAHTIQVALNAALASGFAGLDRDLASPSPWDQFTAWSHWIDQQTVDVDGWRWSSAACQATPSGSTCQIVLSKNRDSLETDLLRAHPHADIKGATARLTVRLPAAGASRAMGWRDLPWAGAVRLPWLRNLELLDLASVKYQMTASSPVVVTLPTPPPPGAQFHPGEIAKRPPTATVPLGVAEGKIVIAGSGWWSAAGVMQYLNASDLRLDRLKTTLARDGTMAWTMQWHYWVRTATAPTLPVVQGIKGPIPLILPPRFAVPPRARPSPSTRSLDKTPG